MKQTEPLKPTEKSPFQRFSEFVRHIVAVPKIELPAQERKFQKAKKRRKDRL